MAINANKEKLGFQSEAKQLLHLMIHSLYSNREIFIRELLSNASDAVDRLRFAALSDESLLGGQAELEIRLELDAEARTVSVTDNGIGMSREEVVDNLGTIAKSGTAQFLESLTGDERKDSLLIGQFGVGFYSAFIVADRVTVETRKAGARGSEGVRWTSAGEAEFEVETIARADRGTKVTLHLRPDAEEFLDAWRLRGLVSKYADHLSVPVKMLKEQPPEDAAEDEKEADGKAGKAEAAEIIEYETVNQARALWSRSRADISADEYKSFYKHVSHDFQEPLDWSHNRVEGGLDYTSLVYIPARAPFDLYQREAPRGLKLYVQRVFIMDDAEQFLPLYLRFVKGVVDSNDLSLNVSRELLQKDPAIEGMRNALTKRVLDLLDRLAKKDAEKYRTFWDEFGQVMKEGPSEDAGNRERIAKLLRFSTTHTDEPKQDQSLADYVGRMQEGQEKIYYSVADNFATAKNSPHLEVFRKRKLEVLLLSDRIDEWLMSHLHEFDGKPLADVARGELELPETADAEEAKKRDEGEYKPLLERLRGVLGDEVESVRVTDRLTESPACLVVGEHDMGMQMRRIFEAAGQAPPSAKRIFEINPGHPLLKQLADETNDDRFGDLAAILHDQAKLAEGTALADPAAYVRRLNRLLLELSGRTDAEETGDA